MFDGSALPAGVYIVRVTGDDVFVTQPITVLR